MKVDLSAKAVTVRLRRTAQLRRLCLSLGKAKAFERTPVRQSDSAGTFQRDSEGRGQPFPRVPGDMGT